MTARPQRARRDGDAGTLARWRQGWALALRLARRDIGTHRARSLLIVVLVAAPVLLIAGLATAVSTDNVSVEESLALRLGSAQAEIRTGGAGRIEQLADGGTTTETSAEALAVGDHQPGTSWTTAQLGALTGGRIVTADSPVLFAAADDRVTRLLTLSTPAADLPDSGLATLTSGRWPQSADEVLVTDRGRRKGVPVDGELPIRLADGTTEQRIRVVGTVEARNDEYRSYDVVAVDRPGEPGSGTWLLLRDRPVSWAEVRDWNSYGLVTVSRAVVEDPPPLREQPADLVRQEAVNSGGYAGLVALLAVGLLLETSLLAGPAFAVSAARRRRTLAQVAANGADEAQLRRTVLAEALILGAGAAAAGAVVGAFGGWAALAVRNRLDLYASSGPLDLPWIALLGLFGAAMVAALVAASVPARGVSRLAVADVLAGRERSRPVHVLAPAIGLALVLAAGAGLAVPVVLGEARDVVWLFGLSAAVLVVGVLLLVPTLLVAVGRWAPRLPLALRLPVRDTARQRGRAASAVAAVVATVATLTILSVANASDDAHSRATYATDQVAGHGYLNHQRTDATVATAVAEIRRQQPDWVVIRHDELGQVADADSGLESTSVAVVPPGCDAETSLGIGDVGEVEYERCIRLGSDDHGSVQTVAVSTVGGSTAPAAVRKALARGALALSDQARVVDGRVTLAVGHVSGSPQDRVVRTLTVEGVAVPPADLHAAARVPLPTARPAGSTTYSTLPQVAGLLTAEAAEKLGLPTSFGYLEVIDPTGPISERDQAAINDRLLAPIEVERGYQSGLRILLAGLLGVAGVLVLVAALVATALAQAESRADLATLAALGGSPGLRRRLAAGQALVVAGLGALLGFVAGCLPGIALALAFTADAGRDPLTGQLISGPGLVVVPWLPLLAVVVGVPLLAALVAAVAVRRTPLLTRRLT